MPEPRGLFLSGGWQTPPAFVERLAADLSDSAPHVALDAALESLRMADAKHRLAYALLRAGAADLRRQDVEKARCRAEEALRLAQTLDRPTETAMARVILLRCASLRDAGEERDVHAQALRETNMNQVAAHVREEVKRTLESRKGVSRGARTR